MNNRLVCLEGTLDFSEEIRVQNINIVSFSQGQHISITRDHLPSGQSLTEKISQQMDNAQNIFNHFNLVKIDELNEDNSMAETIQIIFNFSSGSGQRLWQVSFASRIAEQEIINFTSVYPDEGSMQKEMGRLKHCIRHFAVHTC